MLAWLKKNRERKFFMFLHGYDCHGQHSPTGGYDYRFVDRNYDRRFTGSEQEHERLHEEGLTKGAWTCVTRTFSSGGRFMTRKSIAPTRRSPASCREFAKLGLTDKTLLVLTSDHGSEYFEHRRVDHGFTLYDEQLRVPLVIRLPAADVRQDDRGSRKQH